MDRQKGTDYERAMNQAFRLLGFRMRTVAEITTRLTKKGYSEEIAGQVVERLKELGYLDDNSYVQLYVKGQIKGRLRLKQELRQRGVNKETFEIVLNNVYPEEIEEENAARLAEKLWLQAEKNGNNLENKQERLKILNKIRRKLMGRGFSYEIIVKAVRQINPDAWESE